MKSPQAPQAPEAPEPKQEFQEKNPKISFEEAVNQPPVAFSSKKPTEDKRPKRKEVNLEELKKTLEESLKEVEKKKEDESPQEL